MTNLNIEVYNLYVETSLKVSQNRLKANQWFIAINGLVIGTDTVINSALLLLFGILVNFLWINMISSYKKLNSAKFKVIHELEENLPYPCFKKEEEFYKSMGRSDFSIIEKYIPRLLITIYSVAFLYEFLYKGTISFINMLIDCGFNPDLFWSKYIMVG